MDLSKFSGHFGISSVAVNIFSSFSCKILPSKSGQSEVTGSDTSSHILPESGFSATSHNVETEQDPVGLLGTNTFFVSPIS